MTDNFIYAKGRDGKIFKFKKGVSRDKMKSAITSYYGAKPKETRSAAEIASQWTLGDNQPLDGPLAPNPVTQETRDIIDLDQRTGGQADNIMAQQGANIAAMQARHPVTGLLPDSLKSKAASAELGITKGATLGFDDEIIGAGTALATDTKYNDARDQQRDRQNAAGTINPVSHGVGEFAGGGATGGAGVARMSALKGGAAVGGAYGVGSNDGDIIDRTKAGATGAALGGALGVLGERGVNIVRNIVGNKQYYRQGQLTQEGQDRLRQAGVDIDNLSTEDIDAIAQAGAGGQDVLEAANLRDAQALGVPATKGNVSRSPIAQRFEEQAEKGVYGERNLAVARDFKAQQNEALGNVAENQVQGMTGQSLPAEFGTGGGAVNQRLAGMAKTSQEGVDAAYTAARANKASAPSSGLTEFRNTIPDMLDQNAVAPLELSAQANTYLKQLDDLIAKGDGVSLTDLDLWRRKVGNAAFASKNAPDGGTLRTIKKGMDAHLDELFDNALIQGDASAIKQWKKARQAFIKHRDTYMGKEGPAKVISKLTNGDLDSTEASQLIFGSRSIGGKTGAGRLARGIKELVGEDSPEWQSLRGEAFMRILGNQSGDTFSGAKFSTELEKVATQNPDALRAFFNPDEILELRRFARVSKMITTRVPGGSNHSGSGIFNMANRFGLAGQLLKDSRMSRFVSESQKARELNKALNPQVSTPAIQGLGGPAGLGAANTQQNIGQQQN